MISIITPVYNGEKFIESCINNIIEQDYPNVEHIIVDGASTDRTVDIVKKYAEKYKHIHWISEPDRGQSHAMNKGFMISTGDIIVYLNADDYFEPNAFHRVTNYFKENPDISFVIGKLRVVDKIENYWINDPKISFKEMLWWWESNSYAYNPSAYFYKRKAQERVGGFNENNHHTMDWEFLLAASRICKMGKINCVLGGFRYIEGTKTHSSGGAKNLEKKFSFSAKYVEHLPQKEQTAYLEAQKNYIGQQIRNEEAKFRQCSNAVSNFVRKVYCKLNNLLGNNQVNSYKKDYEKDLLSMLSEGEKFKYKDVLNYLRENYCYIPGEYMYTPYMEKPVLYNGVYAIMIRSLFNDSFSDKEKIQCVNYINSHQSEDGLFRDSRINNEIAEVEDWWGWRHLSAHVVTALTALDARTRYPFKFLAFLYKKGEVEKWISMLPWEDKADFVSNTIMNYGVLLQYSRDYWGIEEAGHALNEIFSWLDKVQDPDTGCWGTFGDQERRKSLMVQTAYHFWSLYFYDNRPIQYIDKAIDTILETQNKLGGFGVSLNSSACEDIDSIDPLCRFYHLSNYRNKDIEKALNKALPWILINQNTDGGFVFKRFDPLVYGHELMSAVADGSAMFPTWFRTLSIAYISQALKDNSMLKQVDWHFVKCPGYQFWNF